MNKYLKRIKYVYKMNKIISFDWHNDQTDPRSCNSVDKAFLQVHSCYRPLAEASIMFVDFGRVFWVIGCLIDGIVGAVGNIYR
jgi:hypothetical protein